MILVDSSVWIDYLRVGEAELRAALNEGLVFTHPFVIGELACGNLANRREVLALLGNLPQVPVATHAELLTFIDTWSLAGRGIGYVDAHLLASSMLSEGVRLWTHDRRLARVATQLRVAYLR